MNWEGLDDLIRFLLLFLALAGWMRWRSLWRGLIERVLISIAAIDTEFDIFMVHALHLGPLIRNFLTAVVIGASPGW